MTCSPSNRVPCLATMLGGRWVAAGPSEAPAHARAVSRPRFASGGGASSEQRL